MHTWKSAGPVIADIQSETVCKGPLEVLDSDFGVRRRLSLTPKQQSILRREALLAEGSTESTRRDVRDASDSEPQDQSPYLSSAPIVRIDTPSRV